MRILAGILLACLCTSSTRAAEGYTLRSRVLAAGAAQTSTGPATGYRIRGTIGQPATKRSLSANFRLGSGFWHPLRVVAGGRIFFDGFEES